MEGVGPFERLELDFPAGTDPNKADVYLFTGPNGCGKSTLLYALAAGFGGLRLTQPELIARRLTRPGSFVEVATADDAAAIARLAQVPADSPSAISWSSRTAPGLELVGRYHSSEVYCFGRADGAISRWEEHACGGPQVLFDFAALAYAGRPVSGPFRVEAIKELTSHPLSHALYFHDTAHAGNLAQWLVNTRTKAALALRDRRLDVSDRYEESIRQIERALSKVFDEEVTFELGYEPLTVRMRQGGRDLDVDLLAEGVKSIVSWLADVYMRLERLPWVDDRAIHQREFLLFLDEIDIYLHPSLQRRLLPVVQELFPRAQIIASTHSPFVVASATDAWVYGLERDGASARLSTQKPLRGGASYSTILRSVFGIEEEFDQGTEEELTTFYALRQEVLAGRAAYEALVARGESLARRGTEVADIVQLELRQVDRKLGHAPAA